MNARDRRFFFSLSVCIISSPLVFFSSRARGASTYATAPLIRFTGFSSTRIGVRYAETHARARVRREGEIIQRREGWLVDVYLFERSKNYRSGAASRRCLSFDREATMREFARYLPAREAGKPFRSAPLRADTLRQRERLTR